MLTLDFSFSDTWNDTVAVEAIAGMTEIDLRYGVAFGDLILIVNGIDCSARWGWIPLLDVAVSLGDILAALTADPSASETFDFTENDSSINFLRSGESIRITTSDATCDASVPFTEFDTRVRDFVRKVFRDSLERFPTLGMNSVFRSLSSRSNLRR